MITIRPITVDDSAAFLALCLQLDAETQFMMLEPGERTTTAEEQRVRVSELLARPNQTILVADSSDGLAGYIEGMGGDYRRNRHCAYVVIGVRQSFAGQGLGTRLSAALEQWARAHALHRLELTVMTHNERGIALYRKVGFEVEGVKRHSLLVGGTYVDEYAMGKLLSQ
ncbi:MAG: GNAT family N-acetyltransferase [Chloroflexi bacterium]|nr:GNAT family N-acetyltransferase [Chloroflexota bacterium]